MLHSEYLWLLLDSLELSQESAALPKHHRYQCYSTPTEIYEGELTDFFYHTAYNLKHHLGYFVSTHHHPLIVSNHPNSLNIFTTISTQIYSKTFLFFSFLSTNLHPIQPHLRRFIHLLCYLTTIQHQHHFAYPKLLRLYSKQLLDLPRYRCFYSPSLKEQYLCFHLIST